MIVLSTQVTLVTNSWKSWLGQPDRQTEKRNQRQVCEYNKKILTHLRWRMCWLISGGENYSGNPEVPVGKICDPPKASIETYLKQISNTISTHASQEPNIIHNQVLPRELKTLDVPALNSWERESTRALSIFHWVPRTSQIKNRTWRCSWKD